jgi:hypothetical protein
VANKIPAYSMKKYWLSYLQMGISRLNNSKVFAGTMMILMNIGSKYITIKLSPSQEAYFRNNIAREMLIFAVCWMGTRDLAISIILTASFYVLSQHLFNEESRYCVLPKKYREFHLLLDKNNDGVVSQQEIKDAVNILTKAKQQEMKEKRTNM